MTTNINFPHYYGNRFFSASTLADLRALEVDDIEPNANILVDGSTIAGDTGGGFYVWSADSVATDDNLLIIKPYLVTGKGRWLRVSVSSDVGATLASLAASTGAKSIGAAGGGTVQDTLNVIKGVPVSPAVQATFIADGSTAKFGVNMVLTGTSTTLNEIGLSTVLTNNVAAGGGKAYVVAQFGAVYAALGSATAYAGNDVMQTAGTPGTAREFNVNNNGSHSGDSYAENSIYGPYNWVTGTNTVAAGSARILAAHQIDAVPAFPKMFNRGFAAAGDSIRLATFSDGTNSSISQLITGTHSTGIDMVGATLTSAAAMNLNAGQFLNWKIGGTLGTNTLGVSGSSFFVGFGAADVKYGAHLLPGADNAFTLGSAGSSPSNIYSHAALIVVSDANRKTDEKPVVDALAMVNAIPPRSYRMKVGGTVPRKVMMAGKVPVKDADGIDVIDQVPELEADGVTPVMVEVPDFGPEEDEDIVVEQEDGSTVIVGRRPKKWRSGDPVKSIQKTKPEVRMTDGEVEETVYDEVAGKRNHLGFFAQDVKAAFDARGVDYGAWVEMEDGTQALRYEQLIPIVWGAVQELDAAYRKDVAALMARVEALEARTR